MKKEFISYGIKSLLVLSTLAMIAGFAFSEPIDTGIGIIDLNNIVSNTKTGVLVPINTNKTMMDIHTPLLSYHDSEGLELVNFNAGLAYTPTDNKGGPVLSIGLRIDGILNKLGKTDYFKTHINTAILPQVELFPFLTWYGPTHTWIYGVGASTKFGGN